MAQRVNNLVLSTFTENGSGVAVTHKRRVARGGMCPPPFHLKIIQFAKVFRKNEIWPYKKFENPHLEKFLATLLSHPNRVMQLVPFQFIIYLR